MNKHEAMERLGRKGNPGTLLVQMQTGAATVENSIEYPQQTKNRIAFCPSGSTAENIP